MANAPNSAGTTRRAMTKLIAAFVPLDTTWSAMVHSALVWRRPRDERGAARGGEGSTSGRSGSRVGPAAPARVGLPALVGLPARVGLPALVAWPPVSAPS